MQNKVLRNMLIPGVVALLCVLLPFILIECKVIKPSVAQILTLGAVNAIMAISVNFHLVRQVSRHSVHIQWCCLLPAVMCRFR